MPTSNGKIVARLSLSIINETTESKIKTLIKSKFTARIEVLICHGHSGIDVLGPRSSQGGPGARGSSDGDQEAGDR